MDPSARLAQLVSEFKSLDRNHDQPRLREIFSEAATLIDPAEKPKKWAAFRVMYAQMCDNSDPDQALHGYRDALTVFTPAEDRDAWVNCTMNVGMILALRSQHGTPESEEALACLEVAVGDYPWVAATLALLYRFRADGDLAANWIKRVQYQKLALSQIVADEDPPGWADQQNELGLSATEEPGCNFAEAMPQRIGMHNEALALLDRHGLGDLPAGGNRNPAGGNPHNVWIETCIHLCECYLFALGDLSQNRAEAERFGRRAVAACGHTTPDIRRRSRMSLGRVLAASRGPGATAKLHESIQWFELATDDCEQAKPELLANIRALEASAYLDLMRLGETARITDLARCSGEAIDGYIGRAFSGRRRSACQVEASGWIEAENFAEASRCLQAALREGEAMLAETVADASRIERVFQLHDSSALLCYCRLKLGDTQGALEALDRGKARFWGGPEPAAIWGSLAEVIPAGGALLFAVFAAKPGAVIVVTAGSGAEGPHAEPVWLENFGKEEMLALQRGASDSGQLGGWLRAYSFHRSELLNWVREIERVGGVLFESIWKPVIQTLTELGVATGKELVWFPQGGSGVFPVHAAWTETGAGREWLIDQYAIRFAPSATALLRGSAPVRPGTALMVSNPGGDLKFSDLECAWAKRHAPVPEWQVFEGAEASADAILGALPNVDWAHFCTHARFDLVNPLASSLKAGAGQHITLERLLPLLAGRAPGLVVLSACETAMSRVTTMPDEFIGFPGALLTHGVATVIATLWPVDDAAAAVLMGRFYKEFEAGGCSAAEALRRAQSWLRTATVAQLRLMLGELRNEPGPVGQLAAELRMKLFMQQQDGQPFAEPYYWAAFTISGKG